MKPAEWFDLTGRTAIVTGGGSGIGRACALALAEAGASVLVVGRRMEKLEETCAAARQAGSVCEAFSVDLTVEENCHAMVEACQSRFGRVDILINSAGSRGASGDLRKNSRPKTCARPLPQILIRHFLLPGMPGLLWRKTEAERSSTLHH